MRFILEGVDGGSVKQHPNPKDLYHDLSVSAPGATSGTLIIEGKKVGSDVYEPVPDGSIDLSLTNSIQFTGCVESYRFTLSGFSGTGDVTVTDVSQRA